MRTRVVSVIFAAAVSYGANLLAIQDRISQGDLEGARVQLSSELKASPSDGGLWNLLGVVDVQSNRVDEAQADFQNAVRLSPRLIAAHLNLARVYRIRLDSAPALAAKTIGEYETVLRLDPSQHEARFQIATLLEWQGSFAASLAQLDRLPLAERRRSRVIALRCADLGALGHKAEASETAASLAAAPDLSDADVVSALPALEKNGRDELLLAAMRKLRARGAAGAASLLALARIDERASRFSSARETYESVAQLRGVSFPLLLDLARVAYKAGDREGALGYIAHARDLEPGNGLPHFLFGLISLELGVPLDARHSLEKAVAIEPANPNYNYALGVVALGGHDVSEAIPYFRKVSSLRPQDPRPRLGAGIALFYMGKYDEAHTELQAVADEPAVAAVAHYYLGRAHMSVADNAAAAQEFTRAIAARPDYAEAHAGLGLVYIRESRYADAKRELDRALAADADNFYANTNLLVLYQRTKDARAAAQSERLRQLEKLRDERKELMYRSIVVRPY